MTFTRLKPGGENLCVFITDVHTGFAVCDKYNQVGKFLKL